MTLARVAYNPLPWAWVATQQRFDFSAMPPLPELLGQVKTAGFDAIQADIPDAMTAVIYRKQLESAGVAPAPGFFLAPFESEDELGATLESARRMAADQATLGLSEVVVCDALSEVRAARPGEGAERDSARLQRIAEHIAEAARVMVAEGVRPCLHPHVGTGVETADEAETVLDLVDPEHLLLCPDNGHLLWAGADPVQFVRRHAARVGALHIKDVHLDRLAESRRQGQDFLAAVGAHVLTEPGRGDADLTGLLAALDEGFSGWIVIEIDVPDLPTPQESAAAAAAWVYENVHRTATERPA
jgi:inosose dehydratase